MARFVDYYQVLQVHAIAEPEVIEGAYKKLSKKYHPDICKRIDAEEKMKMLNTAYKILWDERQKRDYDAVYQAEQKKIAQQNQQAAADKFSVSSSKAVFIKESEKLLEEYFNCLARGAYDKAYLYISDVDKKQIRFADFADWQRAVAELYEIISVSCSYNEAVSVKDPVLKKFAFCLDFDISIVEIDKRTDTPIVNELQRYTVQENGVLKLYLGYTNVKVLAKRFQELRGETREKSEAYFDKAEILREIKREIARATRYARPFSILVFEALGTDNQQQVEKLSNFIAKAHYTKRLLIRDTDYYGRWSSKRFFLLLPETRLAGAKKTAEKLIEALKKEYNSFELEFCVSYVQFKNYSIQEFIDVALACVIAARKKGSWSMEG